MTAEVFADVVVVPVTDPFGPVDEGVVPVPEVVVTVTAGVTTPPPPPGLWFLFSIAVLPIAMPAMSTMEAAVARGAKNALVVVDMPFMSYQTSVYDAVVNAGRLMKEGRAGAVKLEGGKEVCPQIQAIVGAGIPVCAHLGLTPQSINAFGGFKVQGKTEKAAKKLIADAIAVEEAGAFAVVLEGIPSKLANLVTEKLDIPTIGIGAGNGCDGQVLVYQDMLGMFSDFTPKFVKRYANIGEVMKEAFQKYMEEIQSGAFPSSEHEYKIDDDIIEKLY